MARYIVSYEYPDKTTGSCISHADTSHEAKKKVQHFLDNEHKGGHVTAVSEK